MPPTEVIRFADNVFIEIAGGPGRAEPFSTARFEAVSRSFKESAAALTLVINAISDTISSRTRGSASPAWATRWSAWCDLDEAMPLQAFPAWCRLTRASEFPPPAATDQRPGAQLMWIAQQLALQLQASGRFEVQLARQRGYALRRIGCQQIGPAHHTQHLARCDVERHVVDGQQGAAARREFDAEVADLQKRRIVRCGGHLASNLNAVWD